MDDLTTASLVDLGPLEMPEEEHSSFTEVLKVPPVVHIAPPVLRPQHVYAPVAPLGMLSMGLLSKHKNEATDTARRILNCEIVLSHVEPQPLFLFRSRSRGPRAVRHTADLVLLRAGAGDDAPVLVRHRQGNPKDEEEAISIQ
jgi:hypothetical protein